jgi:hypothetical protein
LQISRPGSANESLSFIQGGENQDLEHLSIKVVGRGGAGTAFASGSCPID